MKKIISSLAIAAIMTFGFSNVTIGQGDSTTATTAEVSDAAKAGSTTTTGRLTRPTALGRFFTDVNA